MTDEAMTADEQVAAELRQIAEETECDQRKMHLYIAADIVRQGRFEHPDNFAYSIEIDALRTRIAELEAENAALRDERASMWRAGVSDTVVIFDRVRERIKAVKWFKKNVELLRFDGDLDDQFGKWFSFTRGRSPADYNETQDLRREFAALQAAGGKQDG